MESKKLLLVGGGGHCRSILDCLRRSVAYNMFGIVDRESDSNSNRFGVPVVGSDAELPELYVAGWTSAVIALGSIGACERRHILYENLKAIGFSLPVVMDPSSQIGTGVVLEEGTFIGKNAIVNAGAQVGRCAIINTGAIVEHDCSVGDFVHVSPGCTLCGGVVVDKNSHIGAGSVVRQQIHIGSNCLIGAGSVVVSNIPEGTEAFGNPCRVIKVL